jgi:membrane-associated protease RseP (regulator of RpoE activity)
MDELQVLERMFTALSQTPAFVLALLILLVVSASPIAITWMTRRKGDNTVVPGLIKIMGETNEQIATNVELSRKAIEHSNEVMRQMAGAITGFNERAEEHFAETHKFLEPIAEGVNGVRSDIATLSKATTEQQTLIIDKLDMLESLVTDTVKQFVNQIEEHDKRAGERARQLAVNMEARFGELLAELRVIRDSVNPDPEVIRESKSSI